jgi:cell division septation protein DedD
VPCAAQTAAADSALQRARRLVNAGNAAAGRAVVDSVVQATPEGSPAFAEALYWRATLAETAERARRDYLRITLDFPIHARAADAILRLAQFEFARGDRVAARRYLEQLALEHGDGPTAAEGALWTGRVLLEDGATLEACAALARAKARARPDDVELQGQITYYAQPCVRARADSVARADSASRAVADSARADSIARTRKGSGRGAGRGATKGAGTGDKGAAARGPAWSAQVAAYAQRDDAERLAKKLRARGYEARVTVDRPYRVRIGRFGTRTAAAGLVEKLRSAKMAAIVVEAERP